MAYDEELADRVRELAAGEPGLTEKRMFGGLAFLVNGNLAVAASSEGGLLVRVDPSQTDDLLRIPVVRRMQMQGRHMNGWLRVDAAPDDEALAGWVERGLDCARSLPPK